MRARSFLVPGFILLLAHSAFAQTDQERAAARDAASAGVTAFDAGRYEQAIDSFSRAEQLVHAPTHLLFLARAQSKTGKLVAAHENYLKIARETLAPGAPKAFADAKAAAEQERPQLDARLPSVTIAVQGGSASDLEVQMDGTQLPAAMVGIPLPVDPGPHVFQASAAAGESAPVTVTLAEGGKQTVLLTLTPKAGPSTAAITSSAGNDQLATDAPPSTGHGLRTAAYVSFGVGAVGIGLGTVFLLKSESTRSSSEKLYDACNAGSPGGKCSDPAQEAVIVSKDHDVDSQRNLGAASLVVGGVGAAAGVVLLILDARRSHSATVGEPLHITPVIGFRSLGVIGSF
jgi:hypothetical protein